MQDAYKTFLQKFPRTGQDKPLAPFNSMGIGGPADLYYKLTSTEDLPAIIKSAIELKIPFIILGGGSNTIFADEGFRGLIIHMQAKKIALEPAPLEPSGPTNPSKSSGTASDADFEIISAEAGALLSQVIQFALKHNLTGMEKLMGLPGTIGGAVRGNAGAFGTETKDIFHKAIIFRPEIAAGSSPDKALLELGPAELKFGYRDSNIKHSNDIVLKVYLKLKKDPLQAKTALAEAMDILKNRISRQPKGKCSGSFFKNPSPQAVEEQRANPTQKASNQPGLKAGHLLEQAGCKGLQIGKAQVSPEHANWIMNLGGATQKDVLELSRIMQEKVKNRFNITLEREVQFMSPTGFLND